MDIPSKGVVDTTVARVLHLERPMGMLITDLVKDSPAVRAGLKKGDVILKVDDREVERGEQYQSLIVKRRPGERVTLTIIREGKEQQIDVVLGEFPPRR
jgi:serine protease Do